jgi:hypothetical protein
MVGHSLAVIRTYVAISETPCLISEQPFWPSTQICDNNKDPSGTRLFRWSDFTSFCVHLHGVRESVVRIHRRVVVFQDIVGAAVES